MFSHFKSSSSLPSVDVYICFSLFCNLVLIWFNQFLNHLDLSRLFFDFPHPLITRVNSVWILICHFDTSILNSWTHSIHTHQPLDCNFLNFVQTLLIVFCMIMPFINLILVHSNLILPVFCSFVAAYLDHFFIYISSLNAPDDLAKHFPLYLITSCVLTHLLFWMHFSDHHTRIMRDA